MNKLLLVFTLFVAGQQVFPAAANYQIQDRLNLTAHDMASAKHHFPSGQNFTFMLGEFIENQAFKNCIQDVTIAINDKKTRMDDFALISAFKALIETAPKEFIALVNGRSDLFKGAFIEKNKDLIELLKAQDKELASEFLKKIKENRATQAQSNTRRRLIRSKRVIRFLRRRRAIRSLRPSVSLNNPKLSDAVKNLEIELDRRRRRDLINFLNRYLNPAAAAAQENHPDLTATPILHQPNAVHREIYNPNNERNFPDDVPQIRKKEAAIKIQKSFRGYKARKVLQEKQEATIIIQKLLQEEKEDSSFSSSSSKRRKLSLPLNFSQENKGVNNKSTDHRSEKSSSKRKEYFQPNTVTNSIEEFNISDQELNTSKLQEYEVEKLKGDFDFLISEKINYFGEMNYTESFQDRRIREQIDEIKQKQIQSEIDQEIEGTWQLLKEESEQFIKFINKNEKDKNENWQEQTEETEKVLKMLEAREQRDKL
jgi:hypothetical protein